MEKMLAWRKSWWWLLLMASPEIALPLIVVGLLLLLIVLFWLPFLILTSPNAFQMDSVSSSADWWDAPGQLPATTSLYQWPVPHLRTVTTPFRAGHPGIDIAAPEGDAGTAMQPVYALAAGTVTTAGSDPDKGVQVIINHGNGLVSSYTGLGDSLSVKAGDTVAKGQMLGRIGRSPGTHLVLSIQQNGIAVDPLTLVQPPQIIVPKDLQYQDMNIYGMKAWLDQRNSALADVTVLSAINEAGKSQNVDPYLLVAITGQEQSFVPKNGNHASEIIRNPWNVFGCWCSGRGATLTTGQAASIAAQTIVKLSQDRPDGFDAIEWIDSPRNPNGVYAEDSHWWIGVSRFYHAIHEDVTTS